MMYEEVKRELARVRRSKGVLSGIRIRMSTLKHETEVKLLQESMNMDSVSSTPKSLVQPVEISEREILVFAQCLQHETRGEDICARMGSEEFLILLIDFKAAEDIFIERLLIYWRTYRSQDRRLSALTSPELIISFAASTSDDNALDFLNRIDLASHYRHV